MTADFPPPPKDLSAVSKALWRATLKVFEMSDAELEVWHGGLVMRDIRELASAEVLKEGTLVRDRFGFWKQNPAADVAIRANAAYDRAVAQLGLKLPDQPAKRLGHAKPGPKPRPPANLRRVG